MKTYYGGDMLFIQKKLKSLKNRRFNKTGREPRSLRFRASKIFVFSKIISLVHEQYRNGFNLLFIITFHINWIFIFVVLKKP